MKQVFRETIQHADSPFFTFASNYMPTSFPEHWHTLAEIILAKKDNCMFTINGEAIQLNANEVLIFWPTELHSTLTTSEDSYVVFQFSANLITDCKDFNIYYHSLRNIHKLTDISLELNRYFRSKLNEIASMHSESFAEPKILITIYEMMITLCQHIHDHNIHTKSHFNTTDPTFCVIKKACSYIDENCDRNLTQAEVAEYCGFSSYYFSKLFHKYTSETFPEYLTKRRINVSTHLLQNNALSISEVSSLSGFQSISNFNKLFKKHLNCTPLQYRKLYSEENYTSAQLNQA